MGCCGKVSANSVPQIALDGHVPKSKPKPLNERELAKVIGTTRGSQLLANKSDCNADWIDAVTDGEYCTIAPPFRIKITALKKCRIRIGTAKDARKHAVQFTLGADEYLLQNPNTVAIDKVFDAETAITLESNQAGIHKPSIIEITPQ